MLKNKYTFFAILLHWFMALLIITTWSIGFLVSDMTLSPAQILGISWHKWLGVTILFLVLIRIFWRAKNSPPSLEIKMPKWQHKLMELTHGALYILMLLVPILGWLMSSAEGYTVNYFGLFELPDLIQKNKNMGDFLDGAHAWCAHGLIILVSFHVLAALKHQFWDKDGLLRRMSFSKNKS